MDWQPTQLPRVILTKSKPIGNHRTMVTTQHMRDEFVIFLNRWKKHFEENYMSNEDIVNDFMWSYRLYGEEIYNELLAIIENDKQD